jgi:hypothetical protein
MGELRDAFFILVGKPEEKKPRGRPKHDGRVILKQI